MNIISFLIFFILILMILCFIIIILYLFLLGVVAGLYEELYYVSMKVVLRFSGIICC